MNLLRSIAIAFVGLLVIPLAGVDAGSEKVAFPANFRSGVLYQFLVEGAGVKTEYLLKGQTGTVVLKEPGVYQYGDTFYPAVESLRGVIEVRK